MPLTTDIKKNQNLDPIPLILFATIWKATLSLFFFSLLLLQFPLSPTSNTSNPKREKADKCGKKNKRRGGGGNFKD